MRDSGVVRSRALFFLLLFLFCCSLSRAQDTPQYDNTMGLLPPEGFTPRSTPAQLLVITSPEGFDNFDIGVDFAEPHASMNPRNPLQIFTAWNTNSTRYTHNGHDWASQEPVFGAIMRGDPVTAYDSLGNLYYENMFGTTSIVGCKVIRSTDNGLTWSTSVTAISGVDKNWIAADQTMGPYANYVYTTMTATSAGNFARSTDFGATWTTTFSPTTQTLPGMMVCVGANVVGTNVSGGCVYVVTNSGNAFSATYTFYRSTNGGATFSLMSAQNFAGYVGTNVNGRHSIQGMRTRPYPFIAADNSFGPYRGRLYLVYASNVPAGNGNKPDIFCRYSTDHGATWSSPVTVNDDLNSQLNHQWMPAIWCDKQTGRLYVKWYDTRNTPTSDSTDVYAAYSDNGGLTFSPNQRLTTRKFRIDCTTCGGGGTPRYQGDYDAIVSNAQGAMAVWTDFRNGNFGSFTAYFPDFAMLASPSTLALATTDSASVKISVPAVKLYTHAVRFLATVSPAGNISLIFPQRDSLTTYPDSLAMTVKTNNASPGAYTVTITGSGPNGMPVHRRNVTVVVSPPPPTVVVLQPNGGEVWPIGAVRTIQWNTTNLTGPVRVELSRNGGITFPEVLFASTTDDGSEDWIVTGPPTASAKVRISSVGTPSAADTSNGVFSIVQPSLTVVSPNGGEVWPIGAVQQIRWTSGNLSGNVRVELSRNGGATFPETLFASVPDTGAVPWTVAGPASSTALVRITSIAFPAVADTSNSVFTLVQPSLSVLAPNGGESWLVGAHEVIRWSSAFLTGNVKIELSRNGGLTFPEVLFTGLPASGSQTWQVTLPATTGGKVRISSEVYPAVRDTTDATFRIADGLAASVAEGWNLLSLSLTVPDRSRTTLFPDASSPAYAFGADGYVVRDTLRYREGFWLKYPASQVVTVTGSSREVDTVYVVQGWNLLGTISYSLPVDSVVGVPPGIVASSFFGYTGGAYLQAAVLEPMGGYWVKASQAGLLLLRRPAGSPARGLASGAMSTTP